MTTQFLPIRIVGSHHFGDFAVFRGETGAQKSVEAGMFEVSDFGVSKARLEALCKQYGVKELSIFGSRARGDHRADSDIDLLVEFFPDTVLGLIGYGTLQDDLAKLFGKKVDLVSKPGLKPIVRHEVLPEARVLYEAS